MHFLPKILRRSEPFDLLSESDSMNNGICIQDLEHTIIYQNVEHRNWFGNNVGKKCYEIHTNCGDACWNCAIAESVEKNTEIVKAHEICIHNKWFEVTTRPLIDSSAKYIGGIEIVKDITNSKHFDIFFSDKFNDICTSTAFRLATCYALLSIIWITFSDTFIHTFIVDPDIGYFVELTKGSIFVGLTSTVLFLVLYKLFKNIQYKEIALAKSQKKYHSIVELSPDIIISHKRGIITYINNIGISTLGGESIHDFVGKRIDTFMSKDSELVRQLNLLYKREGSYINSLECKMKTLHHYEFDAEVSSCSYSNGLEVYAQSVIRDITERNRVQNQLKESERLFRDMVENMKLLALIIDTEGSVEFCNEYFCNLVDFDKAHVIGCNWFDTFIPKQALEESKSDFYSAIKTDAMPIHGKSCIITKTGAERVIYWNNTIMRNSDDLITGITIIGEDVTDNIRLENTLKMKNIELMEAYDTTLQGWSRALDLRDHETEGHSQRVTEWSVDLALKFGLTKDDLIDIRRGALLHDIGKMGVPDSILLKPGALDKDELKIMQQHPVLAYELLSPIPFLGQAITIPFCHHERWDGLGYPRGLYREAIPLTARIFSVVDVYDALNSDRPYRKAWDKERIINYLLEESGKMFDPEVVEVFIDYIKSEHI